MYFLNNEPCFCYSDFFPKDLGHSRQFSYDLFRFSIFTWSVHWLGCFCCTLKEVDFLSVFLFFLLCLYCFFLNFCFRLRLWAQLRLLQKAEYIFFIFFRKCCSGSFCCLLMSLSSLLLADMTLSFLMSLRLLFHFQSTDWLNLHQFLILEGYNVNLLQVVWQLSRCKVYFIVFWCLDFISQFTW